MANVTVGIHLREQDIGQIRAERVRGATTDGICLQITPEVVLFTGHGTDETALVLAALMNACTEALKHNAERAADQQPQPGAGAEYGMEAERG